jgi:hypothetical protein
MSDASAWRTLARLRRRRADYRSVFDSDPGWRVIADLFRFCRMAQPSFVAGDSHATAYQEGMRRVFLRIAGILRMDEERFAQLLKESDDE